MSLYSLRSLIREIVTSEVSPKSAKKKPKVVKYVEQPADLELARRGTNITAMKDTPGHYWTNYVNTYRVKELAEKMIDVTESEDVRSDVRDVLAALDIRSQMEAALDRSIHSDGWESHYAIEDLLNRGLSYLRPILRKYGVRKIDDECFVYAARALETLAWIEASPEKRADATEYSVNVISPLHALCAAALRGINETFEQKIYVDDD